MPDIHVGFEEDDEWESRPNQRDDYRTTEDDGVTGTDPHDVVTVSATPTGQVTTVRIADQWRD
ncbi:MAG TPA: hypothetical protein VG327_06375 [Mycobacterium sp.]|nr:hypothetical protein [Mycobacterium sp.]